MQREPQAYLWGIQQGCVHVTAFLQDIDFEGYAGNVLVRPAVERQLQNIGEALTQLARLWPELAARIPEHRSLIGFRNVLVHGYAWLRHDEVWRAIEQSLPGLHHALNTLLAEFGPTTHS